MTTETSILRILREGAFRLGFAALISMVTAQAQTLPLEIRQSETPYNLQSVAGVPISTTAGDPPGSDGNGPTVSQQTDAGLTTTPANLWQFQGHVNVGGLAAPAQPGQNAAANVDFLQDNKSLPANGAAIGLPSGTTGGGTLVLQSARVGAPYVSRAVSFLFGEIIPVPEKDEQGVLLSTENTALDPDRPVSLPQDYWLAEPFTTNDHEESGYYWSPHARRVFAIQPGPIDITWKKSRPSLTKPADFDANPGNYSLEDGNYFTLYKQRYLVSGSTIKTPRKMYWTEKTFRSTGKPVNVPAAQVGAVNVVYSNNFLRRVTEEYKAIGESSIVEEDPDEPDVMVIKELRTLWYDDTTGQIKACNKEGRAFVELLGDPRPDGVSREFLGFEIVDVIKQPNPSDVITELGDRLTAYQDGLPDDANLFPEPLQQVNQNFAYRHSVGGTGRFNYYAVRETANQNDFQMHWLEEGSQGLLWPFLLVRYQIVWPSDPARYSHYIRPLVATEEEAQATAGQLPNENAPFINYQDPLDQPRAKLTERFELYTFLTPQFPAHRTLLRYVSGENIAFERVFSWLDVALRNPAFDGTPAADLTSWDAENDVFNWPAELTVPRLVNQTVFVGDRITAPPGESGGSPGADYLAGYIHQVNGNSFHPDAYVDPFVQGFEEANRGAIIPVNAIPGNNRLDVWWFRRNGADPAEGFSPTYWPSVLANYTVQWPTDPREIVLASNDGSGPLESLQAKGRIYVQNDRDLPGWNYNEEHALIQGGQAFALRDDLNVTVDDPDTQQNEYTSHPFVLLDYTESDDRPAMRVFRVLREKPSEGLVFRYDIEAGSVLQPPTPLPLLEKAFAPKLIGSPPLNLNEEIPFYTITTSSLRVPVFEGLDSWQLTTDRRHVYFAHQPLVVQNTAEATLPSHSFYPTAADFPNRTLEGFLYDAPPIALSEWTGDPADPDSSTWIFAATNTGLTAGDVVYVIDQPARRSWPVRVAEVQSDHVTFQFDGGITEELKAARSVYVPVPTGTETGLNDWRLAGERLPGAITDASLRDRFASFTLQDRKGNTWIYRGPHTAGENPSMVMQF